MSSPDTGRPAGRNLAVEVWIVLGLSLGASGVYALVSLIRKATLPGGLGDQTATLNASRDDREVFDFVYQVLGIGFALVPVALALYLLSLDPVKERVTERLGLDRHHARFDALWGMGLAAVIGLPGLGLYGIGRLLGITAQIIPAPDISYWWTVPVLILAALQNAILEEVVVIGYLMTRLRQRSWGVAATIVTAAALRGSYHLYQGVGPGLGNFVMGLVFGYWFHRTGRVMPLVIAHTILDVVAFVGYLLLGDSLGLT
ncbi:MULTISPECIES: CPBP family intramembrane glutamic endopeptidase [Aeromicrobium]|uniref:CPBP family intramembrane glutamic endopeptidase n=1 Tax=Aeromicrobium TaxID=2040 RepID=UPI000700C77F|nr:MULTISPECIES: CPBP family intramembrane glutamic endopeptidase [Aeromicrobium]KQX75918.1 CAAX protease [Aeromicrobium sp. Root472D3]MCL8250531.1 CPBP family intramembrane metalloprotease [Aeromicrobium fastidiosum]